MFSGRTVLSVSRLARPRPAAPPCAPTRPTLACPGFGFDKLCLAKLERHATISKRSEIHCVAQVCWLCHRELVGTALGEWGDRHNVNTISSVHEMVNLSNPKHGHITGESGRGARRGGGAGSGRTGCQQNCSPRRQESLVPSKVSKTRRLNVSPEARTSENLCKPNAGTKSAFDNRFVSGLSAGGKALFVPGC